MTDEKLIETLLTASAAQDSIPLKMLLLIAAERIKELMNKVQ